MYRARKQARVWLVHRMAYSNAHIPRRASHVRLEVADASATSYGVGLINGKPSHMKLHLPGGTLMGQPGFERL